MRARIGPCLFALCIGCLCVAAAYRGLTRLAAPSLVLHIAGLEEGGNPRLALRFVNAGRRPLYLDLAGMEFFVSAPRDGSRLYQVHVGDGGAPTRGGGIVALRPGEHIDVGDLVPSLDGISGGRWNVVAVYSASATGSPEVWRGVAKSLPFVLQAAEG